MFDLSSRDIIIQNPEQGFGNFYGHADQSGLRLCFVQGLMLVLIGLGGQEFLLMRIANFSLCLMRAASRSIRPAQR